MTPRKLLPFLAVFLVLAATYFVLEWHRGKVARDEDEAKNIFAVKGPDITAITIKRPAEEIHLVRDGMNWRLDRPITEQADNVTMNALLAGLSQLRLTRDLGPEKDLKPFGLDQPPLVVSFAVGDKSYTLDVGKKSPGEQGYYARRDKDPRVLIINTATKESLDRPLADLRNRALFDFSADKVKVLKVKTGSTQVVLEKKGNSWTWNGREDVKIYPDRLERLLRFLSLARVKEFVPGPPKDLKTYGLEPPALEITVGTDKGEQHLFLGSRKKDECYARQGDQAPVVLMESLLLDFFTVPLESVAGLKQNPLWENVRGLFPIYLEDRRLWTGEVKDVASLTWGSPEKTWTAARDGDFYKLTGPDKKEIRQPAIRLELALLKLRELEAERPLSSVNPGEKGKNFLELRGADGKSLFRLDDLGVVNGQVRVRYTRGAESPREALVAKTAYDQWQKDMEQFTIPPPSPGKK
jgi:hypothetical protein